MRKLAGSDFRFQISDLKNKDRVMGREGDKRILECGMRNKNKICPYFWVRQWHSFHCILHKFVGLAIARSHMPGQ